MAFRLNQVVPWGRSLKEYRKMFNLTPDELQLNILDCAAGPASFNAQLTAQGTRVISCDPLYEFRVEQIGERIAHTYVQIIQELRNNQEHYIWKTFSSPEDLGAVRIAAMGQFLQDFPQGIFEGRYVTAQLPQLPFQTQEFELALCSHFLFSYSEFFSQAFHLQAIAELCRVAREVRIFPLLTIAGDPSPYLTPVMESLSEQGYEVEIQPVGYEFQRGGDRMLRVQPPPQG